MKKFMCSHIFCLLLIEISCRKYDLESEAVKIHGEDLQTVLKRFRKTPDYLTILNDKMKELLDHKENVGMMTMHHFTEKLNKKIGEMLGLDEERAESTTSVKPQNFFRDHFMYRRQQSENNEKLTPVQILDSYPKLSSALSVAERNSYMDLGFEYAGHIIHTMIKSLGPEDDATVKSTRLPYGGDHHHEKVTSTTEHVHVHEVTSSATSLNSTVAPETTTTTGVRHRYKSQRN